MAIYQSVHSGQYIDEQISAVSEKLSLKGGVVNGNITAQKFIGNLQGKADNAENAKYATSAGSSTTATQADNIYVENSLNKIYVAGVSSNATGYQTVSTNTNVYIENSVLMGAAWNDYAEYRKSEIPLKPGYCVTVLKDGTVSLTSEHMQYCEGIISDTFGFSIGHMEGYETPLAVSGRVLAYFNGDINDYEIGDPVCAGPNGKISKMSREEICTYPDRLIGTVSEIPNYEFWGANNIKIDKRIWIKVR